ncbi:MAG: poly-gamma-glutamate hydrolase family protein [Acidimicrobiales bacterium]
MSEQFAQLLATPGVEEVCELRSRFGFMAFHGGALEEMTDVIARAAAERTGASYYGVHQPKGLERHIPSTRFDPAVSERLRSFVEHVHTVITIHGFGRRGMFHTLLVGGRNRLLAHHVGDHLRRRLPAYEIATDLDRIPRELQGLHAKNPVNLPERQGVQIELPPRVRGTTPLFWDWEGPGLTPHTQALVDGLVDAVDTWPH